MNSYPSIDGEKGWEGLPIGGNHCFLSRFPHKVHGEEFQAAYGSFVSTGQKSMLPGKPVTFDLAVVPPQKISFTPGGTWVTVEAEGIYLVQYSIFPNLCGETSMHLEVDGVALPGSKINMLACKSQISACLLAELPAGARVSIGTSGVAVTLGPDTNAYLTLYKLSRAPLRA